MKKLFSLVFSFLILASLSGCGHNPTVVKPDTQKETAKAVRTSGPLAEKEVGWDQEDYS